MPLALFYPLWYASGLAPAYIFAVTTGVFGIITGIEWAYRSWRLYRQEWVRPFGVKKNGVRGVLIHIRGNTDRGWGQFDFFHISYTIGYTISLVSKATTCLWCSER